VLELALQVVATGEQLGTLQTTARGKRKQAGLRPAGVTLNMNHHLVVAQEVCDQEVELQRESEQRWCRHLEKTRCADESELRSVSTAGITVDGV